MTSWGKLLESESALRHQLRGSFKATDGERLDDPKLIREWWGLVGEILAGAEGQPIPVRLLKLLASIAGYLSVGNVPPPITSVAMHPGIGPTEKHDIRMAVTYREAVARKLVHDSQPVRTIMKAYGVRSARTVQQWCKRYEPFTLGSAECAADMRTSGNRYRLANRRTVRSHAAKKKKTDPARSKR